MVSRDVHSIVEYHTKHICLYAIPPTLVLDADRLEQVALSDVQEESKDLE